MSAPSEETLALLRNEFPVDAAFERKYPPRISLLSQDKTEEVKNPKTGKKEINVIAEAGTFSIERQSDDVDEVTGKKLWEKTEIGTELEGIILFNRKQLRYYDKTTDSFIQSPIYDQDDEIIPLRSNGAEIDRGTPKELQAKYPGLSAAGKPKSKLEDYRILYVLFKEEDRDPEMYEIAIRGTSMYAYRDYVKVARPSVPAVITSFGSEYQKNGATEWHKMTFAVVRPITAVEANQVLALTQDLKAGIAEQKAFFAEREKVANDFAAA